jgi:uncharacterized membrane protein
MSALIFRGWLSLLFLCYLVPSFLGGTELLTKNWSNLRNPILVFLGVSVLLLFYGPFRERFLLFFKEPEKLVSERFERIFTTLFFALSLFIVIRASYLIWYSFRLNAEDFAVLDAMVVGLPRGELGYIGWKQGIHHLSIHSTPLVFLFTPFRHLFGQIALPIGHGIVVWSALFPIWLILKRMVSVPIYRLLLLLALFHHMSLVRLLMFSFHYEVFYVAFGMWFFYFFFEKRWWGVFFAGALFALVKEDGPFYLGFCALGLTLFPNRVTRKQAVILGLLAVAILGVHSSIISYFNPADQHVFQPHMSKYGGSLKEAVLGMLMNPHLVAMDMLGGGWVKFCFSFLFLSLFSPAAVLMILAYAGIHTSSNYLLMNTGGLYYTAPLIPFLFGGFIDIFSRDRFLFGKFSLKRNFRPYIIAFVFLFSWTTGSSYVEFYHPPEDYKNMVAINQVFKPGDSVCAQGSIYPHLSYDLLRASFRAKCLQQEYDYYIFNPSLDPFHFTKEELEFELEKTQLRSNLSLERIGGFYLFRSR